MVDIPKGITPQAHQVQNKGGQHKPGRFKGNINLNGVIK